jgi:hypothetical protein
MTSSPIWRRRSPHWTKKVSGASYQSGLGDLGDKWSAQVADMKHVDMRKLPAAAQEERRRQVIGLRQAGQAYDAIAA